MKRSNLIAGITILALACGPTVITKPPLVEPLEGPGRIADVVDAGGPAATASTAPTALGTAPTSARAAPKSKWGGVFTGTDDFSTPVSANPAAGEFRVNSTFKLTIGPDGKGSFTENHEGNEIRGTNLAPPSTNRAVKVMESPDALLIMDGRGTTIAKLRQVGGSYRLFLVPPGETTGAKPEGILMTRGQSLAGAAAATSAAPPSTARVDPQQVPTASTGTVRFKCPHGEQPVQVRTGCGCGSEILNPCDSGGLLPTIVGDTCIFECAPPRAKGPPPANAHEACIQKCNDESGWRYMGQCQMTCEKVR